MAQITPTAPGMFYATGIATQHDRGSAAAAATLGSLVTIPTRADGHTPDAVTLQVEAGQANTVYYTVDGSAPSAINGFSVPVAPAQLLLPYPQHLKNSGAVSATNQQIQLFAAAATNFQALFEWWY